MTKKDTVINYIKNEIKTGNIKKGGKIPSKKKLAEYFGFSSNTVQRAVYDLVRENILFAKNGSGVYVKDSLCRNKIIIGTKDSIIYSENRKYHRDCIEYLKNKLLSMGYEPEVYIESSLNSKKENLYRKLDLSRTAGFVSVFGSNKYINYFIKKNIPCISFVIGNWPFVMIDTWDIQKQIYSLTEKYMGKKPLIFEYYFSNYPYYSLDSMYNHWRDIYDFARIRSSHVYSQITNNIENEINKLDFVPTGVVFADNTLYECALPLFEKYSHIFGNTKILTDSNNTEFFPEGYRICRIQFSAKEHCDKITEILEKQIKGEKILVPNFLIKGKIVNEKALE